MNKNISDDLKPCPFCGSLARYKIGTFDNTNITEVHVVINHNKKCILRNTHSDLPVCVIESWNTRILEKRGIK